jgi:hypothetical protein
MIHVINIKQEDKTLDPGYFYIGRSKNNDSPLGNPFTHTGKRSNLAKLSFKTAEQAIKAFDLYFDEMYGKDEAFTKAFDEIYEYYKTGKDVYLGCFCKPGPCHGDVIAKKLQQKLVKERLEEMKHNPKKIKKEDG